MKIASMLNDVFVSLFKRPFTELYPYAAKPAPGRLRGKLLWDEQKCDGCKLCIRDCPARAIELEKMSPAVTAEADSAARTLVYHYHMDRCIYCAQCVSSCPEGALSMSSTLYHLASADKAAFTEVYRAKGTGVCKEEETPV
jgi:formate hydrogenlyase subunit 6/NADH:ubiquinone oxidoreductase subunit I